ncbi:N-6 DNA methylase [Limosilactobacillus coleohominis]|uniref:N-6 DNA methylase n=1 Tax=Limosilactobacillus coleohominis TaxID=181675 RepID=UPI0026EFE261|nr:N-6 DNA methylase [Limosilactobacillus coleohominis]
MSRKEGSTDLLVDHWLNNAGIKLDYQSSTIKAIDDALHTGSKKLNGNPGYPEYVGLVKDFLIVIEDKGDISDHIFTKNDVITTDDPKVVPKYALNGALHYARHILKHTSYKKCFAFGVSGNEKMHRITPLYVDERLDYQQLPDVESFISFNDKNIDEYYLQQVLHEDTDEEKTTADILRDAATLHESLRTYGQLKDVDKPLVVSGILLALREGESHNFNIDDLTGDTVKTDGDKIMEAIKSNLQRSNVQPTTKRDKLINQFRIITDSAKLNTVDIQLGMTPLHYYTDFINKTIYRDIRYTKSSEDYLGRFYGEFMSYSGGDGQSLGIILTPKHITQLFCDLVDLKPTDTVLDPTCGTGGFLIAAMHNMLSQTDDESQRRNIRRNQLHGIELQDYMFTIATTNMILRGDGKSNLKNEDLLVQPAAKLQTEAMATVGMMNPPYSQGSKEHPEEYEIHFIKHLLDSCLPEARVAVIVPQSTMVGKSKAEKQYKADILKHHTLEGVITCNPNTFYGVGTNPVIAVFTTGIPHDANKQVKFIDFRDDGYKVRKHVGLVATPQAKDRRQYLLDVWHGKVTASTKFCVTSTVKATDEWLHSFYYFNDEVPTDADFNKSIGDYLSFEFAMIMQGRQDLFQGEQQLSLLGERVKIPALNDCKWESFNITDVFPTIKRGKRLKNADHRPGKVPYVSSSAINNGVADYIQEDDNTRTFSNCISLANSGSVGSAFYEPFKFVASDHITHLKLKYDNSFVYLFLTTILEMQKSNFSFNREINEPRIKALKIMLPVTDSGEPDYDYMEQYVKNLMIQKYKQYLTIICQQKK